MERRTLIRLLVGLGIGIPVAIESATFLGLVGQQFGDDDGDGDDGTTTTTDGQGRVGVGDELLPTTAQVERVDRAIVEARDSWRFVLTVTVENTGDEPYVLRLGPVAVDDGSQVSATRSSGTVSPGDSRTFEATWTVPSGTLPVAVTAVGITDPGGDQSATTRTVPLAKVPVSGG